MVEKEGIITIFWGAANGRLPLSCPFTYFYFHFISFAYCIAINTDCNIVNQRSFVTIMKKSNNIIHRF